VYFAKYTAEGNKPHVHTPVVLLTNGVHRGGSEASNPHYNDNYTERKCAHFPSKCMPPKCV